MQLTFRDIEKAFEVGEKTLYQWLNARGMPAVKANDQYYFNSAEVLEWALKNQIALTPGALKFCEKNRPAHGIFSSALERGGVHLGVEGTSAQEVLGKVLDVLPLPEHVQRAPLKEMLVSREHAGTTGIGNGIAIPHVKHPVILAGVEPVVGLFFLKTPVNFFSLDGEPVHTVFVILTGSFNGHLSLLSRVAFCLQDASIQGALGRRCNSGEILAAFQAVESKIARTS